MSPVGTITPEAAAADTAGLLCLAAHVMSLLGTLTPDAAIAGTTDMSCRHVATSFTSSAAYNRNLHVFDSDNNRLHLDTFSKRNIPEGWSPQGDAQSSCGLHESRKEAVES